MNTRTRFFAKASLWSVVTGIVIGPAGLAFAQVGTNSQSNSCPNGNCPQAAKTATVTQAGGWWSKRNASSAASAQRVTQVSGEIRSAGAKVNGTSTTSRATAAFRAARPAAANTYAPAPVAAPANGQSAVQQQLEALYRRDGKQMPAMDVNSAAAAASAGAAAQKVVAAQAPKYQPKPTLMDRILGRKPAAARPVPQIVQKAKPGVPAVVVVPQAVGNAITPPTEPQPFQAPVEAAASNSVSTPAESQASSTEDTADFFPATADSKIVEKESPFSGLTLDDDAELPLAKSPDANVSQSVGDDSREAQYKLLASRTGQPGFKGFCPVTLKTQRKLVDAKPEFKSAYQSVTFTFASAEAKAEFDAAPASFAPAANGIDVVAYDDDGDKVPGTLDFAVWYQGKLFLFSSQDSLDKFVEDPADYADIN
jgi:YHS domain-containing protein